MSLAVFFLGNQAQAQSARSNDETSNRSEDLNNGVYRITILAYLYDRYRDTERYTMTGVLVKEPNIILTTRRFADGKDLFGEEVARDSAYWICESEPDPTRVASDRRKYEEKQQKDDTATARDQARFDASKSATEARAKKETPKKAAEDIDKRLKNSSEYLAERDNCVQASVKKVDPDRRLVLLEARDRLGGGVPLFNVTDPDVGATVKAYGFPRAATDINTRRSTAAERQRSRLIPTVTSGTVAKNEIDKKEGQIVLHQVPVSEGAWGGPLVNNCGQVVGVNSGYPETTTVMQAEAANKSTGRNSGELKPKAVIMPTSNLVVARGAREIRDFVELNGYGLPTSSLIGSACLVTPSTFSLKDNFLMTGLVAGTLAVALAALAVAMRRPGPVRNTVARFFPGMSRREQPEYASGSPYGGGYSGGTVPQETADYGGYAQTGPTPIETVQTTPPPAPHVHRADPTRIMPEGADSGVKFVPVAGGSQLSLDGRRLGTDGLVVGREPDCDIVIDNSTVSKRHARITQTANGKIQIEDLGSANGTFRGRSRIQREAFGNGDVARFGSVEYRVELSGAPSGGGGGATLFLGPLSTWMVSGFDEEGRVVQWQLKPNVDGSGRPVETSWIIGRNAERADKVLSDKRISGEHAKIRFTPQRGLEICDLGSSNGTKVDGKKITDSYAVIDDARVVEFGGSKMSLTKS